MLLSVLLISYKNAPVFVYPPPTGFAVRRTSDGKRDDKVALIVCAILGVASGIILLMSIARFIVIRCQRIRARYIIPVPEEPDESSRLITGSKARLRI